MKLTSTISLLLLALLFSGCLDTESPFGDPVDETDFLEQNALEDDVTVTDSGLQYRIIEEGEGDSPNSESVVFVEYEGSTISGETFIASNGIDDFPLSILNIEGLIEGIQLMKEGSRFEFFIPPELGYGDNPPTNSPLRPGSVLVFDIELDSITKGPKEFLAENRDKEDITEIDSGLQYRIIEEGEGESPNSESVVFVEYVGTTISGETFMDSDGIDYFPISNLNIEGLVEGIQIMTEGSRFEFFIPPELGYGDNPPTGGPLRPWSVLVFDMELDSFLQDPEEFLAENRENEDITETETGLQYRVIKEGSDNNPAEEDEVSARYTGTFTNGYVFDENSDDETTSLNVDEVIPGFSEALQLMGEGAIYEIFVPADIGYGDNTPPSIPDGAILVFEVELDEILQN